MSTYLARLGAFSFSIGTAAFQELQRASEYRWEAKNRIGRKPAQQNVGSGADTIRLSGTIYPHAGPGASHMGVLRGIAAAGEPVPLIYGFERSGQYCGRWCITHIEETRTVFFSNGAPRRIDFSLSLVEYGEDGGAALAAPVSVTAAVGVVTRVDVASAVATASSVKKAAEAVQSQSAAMAMVTNMAAQAAEVANKVSTTVKDVMNSDAVRLAKDGISEFNKVKDQVKAVQSAINSVGNITSVGSAFAALGNLQASSGSLGEVLGGAATKLGDRTGVVSGSSSATVHDAQVKSASASMKSLSGSMSDIKDAAASLRAFF